MDTSEQRLSKAVRKAHADGVSAEDASVMLMPEFGLRATVAQMRAMFSNINHNRPFVTIDEHHAWMACNPEGE